jgi:diketogulonate reductase-like aldo/keto reductase
MADTSFMSAIPTVRLPSGESVPALGQGTWQMAGNAKRGKEEIAALRLGLDLGMTLIDTAEMYTDGAAEDLVAEAIAGRRDEVFLVSKVLPQNAARRDTIAACERSLKRLATDRIDLYLLHWRGDVPLSETLAGFEDLVRSGKIRHWGVSNFDVPDMEELFALPGGKAAATNQVLFNLSRRSIESGLLPWCRKHAVPVMAYSPIEQGRIVNNAALKKIGSRLAATPAQIAIAWLLRYENIIVIPKAGKSSHVEQNHAALQLHLTGQDLADLDRAFPPPAAPRPLETL